VHLWVDSVGNSSFTLIYEISSHGVVHARVKTVQVAVSLDTKKSRPLTDIEREFLKEFMA
jgi:acyl-CoA thioester hydrolase